MRHKIFIDYVVVLLILLGIQTSTLNSASTTLDKNAPLENNASKVPQKNWDSTEQGDISFQTPLCFKDLNPQEQKAKEIRLVIELTMAAQRAYWDRHSLWDQEVLKKNADLELALKEYNQERRGQSLRSIKLRDKTTQELHEELMDKGFAYSRKPVRTPNKDNKEFWKLDGSTTTNPRDIDTVDQIIYVHPDGSMVRVKPAGIPDREGLYPRRAPHAIKAVLLRFNRAKCRDKRCAYDTTYANQAFKVNRFNEPIPKSPTNASGLNLGHIETLRMHPELMPFGKDAVMELAHTNLSSPCDAHDKPSKSTTTQDGN